jgi:hypothetical protein
MGNRAVITTAPFDNDAIGIYVHWNGGRASVEGFLLACKELGYRSPGADRGYAMARLVCAAGVFFDGGLSLGLGTCKELDCDNGDNGVFLIGDDWEIVGRVHHRGAEEINPEKTRAIADQIMHKIRAAEAATLQADESLSAAIAAADQQQAA